MPDYIPVPDEKFLEQDKNLYGYVGSHLTEKERNVCQTSMNCFLFLV
ncbi:MAG: hypothetical protein LBL45_02740 [Treponema sp.]|jgi:hypothetical protein|nr:hypothetical protein [Treponema sp.]